MDDAYRQDFVEAADILFFSAVNYPDPRPLVEVYLRANPRLVAVVGLGSQGCALGTGEGIISCSLKASSSTLITPEEMDRHFQAR